MSLFHIEVACDSCDLPTNGIRYKCLRCANFDLCQDCYDSGNQMTGPHKEQHPFQALLDGATLKIHFGKEADSMTRHADSFTCPCCGELGFSEADLISHVHSNHNNDSLSVICPICVSVPDADPMRRPNYSAHLRLIHTVPGEICHLHAEQPQQRRRNAARDDRLRRALTEQSPMERVEFFLNNFNFNRDATADNNTNDGDDNSTFHIRSNYNSNASDNSSGNMTNYSS